MKLEIMCARENMGEATESEIAVYIEVVKALCKEAFQEVDISVDVLNKVTSDQITITGADDYFDEWAIRQIVEEIKHRAWDNINEYY